jgi:type I restriction enzyme S subunit
MVVSTGFAVVRPKENFFSGFAGYLLQSNGFVGDVVANSVGVSYPAINASDLVRIPAVEPPLEEQKAIARFLDFKTAQIDALIAKQKTLLDKLTEKRTALISHAVTKGLDPTVAMRDSGVAWLGDIPVHWTVSKLAYLSESLQTGPFGSQLHAEEYIEGGVPLINPTDISNGEVLENAKITVGEDVVERLSRHKLELGDIVIARRGEMGRAGLVRERNVGWLCGTGSLRARLNKQALNPEFLLYQFSMRGVAEYLSLQSVGSTMDNLNTSILGRLPVIAPPLHEQAALVLHLRKLSESIDSQAAKVGEVISSLQEYRSALITKAVTGKIDVRGFEIPQPAEGFAS